MTLLSGLTSCARPMEKDDDRLSALLPLTVDKEENDTPVIDAEGKTIKDRFPCPKGAERRAIDESSFGYYLRNLPLRPDGSMVKYYDGSTKENTSVYAAVVDMDLDPRDLQQCADALMRLRGEYLFANDRKEEIHFNFLSDGKPRHFSDHAKGDMSYASFRKYMRYVFAYANTASLKEELSSRPLSEMQIGDVLIQKGRPFGHAVIVVDMCVDQKDGQRYFMLAQSYMPAQDTQILMNPLSENKSVWYRSEEGSIVTPEWTFSSDELHHF